MNGTFMFGHDRFGHEQDYHATYNALGGISFTIEMNAEPPRRICRSTSF